MHASHAGKYVDLANTISGFQGILSGKYDDLPEMAFYMVSPFLANCGAPGTRIWKDCSLIIMLGVMKEHKSPERRMLSDLIKRPINGQGPC